MTDADMLNEIARKAERDMNTYESKTGHARRTGLDDDAGVNTAAEQKFPGARVVYGEGLTKEAYGTERPHRGHPPTAHHPHHPHHLQQEDEALPHVVHGLGPAGDIATQGKAASISNVGTHPPGVGGSWFKGEDYVVAEDVPDSRAAMGEVPPSSVTQASRESEGYGKR